MSDRSTPSSDRTPPRPGDPTIRPAATSRRRETERSPGTVRLTLEPDRTPEEEADLVARVAAAVAEDTGDTTVDLQLIETEHVTITGSVADRLQTTSRWSA